MGTVLGVAQGVGRPRGRGPACRAHGLAPGLWSEEGDEMGHRAFGDQAEGIGGIEQPL